MFEYGNAMDRYTVNPIYVAADKGDFTGRDNYGLTEGEKAVAPIDSIGINKIGKSIVAGHGQGSFRTQLQAAIKQGTGSVEMALSPENGEPGVAAESYGKIARKELREIAMANGVEINSIHAPAQTIGNLSGKDQHGFNEQYRAMTINEVKKAIDFAADVGMGGSVVVHTGEFDRSIMDNFGSGKYSFVQFPGEDQYGVISWVNAKDGKLQQITRTMEFQYIGRNKDGRIELDPDGNVLSLELDENGNVVSQKTGPERLTYNEILKMYKEDPKKFDRMFNHYENIFPDNKIDAKYLNALCDGPDTHPHKAALKAVFGLFSSQQLADAGFRKAMYLDHYLQGKKELEKIEASIKFYDSLPEEERKRHNVVDSSHRFHLIPPDVIDPVKYLQDAQKNVLNSMKAAEDYSMSGSIQERQVIESAKSFRTQEEYALEKSTRSLAELGVYAMQRSEDPEFQKVKKRDIYVAPENIFPEMGYGSHPDELIKLIKKGRDEMIKLLTEKKIEIFDLTKNEYVKADNPYYKGIGKKEAAEEAEQHIKATLDFQHLGMWRKHFQPTIKENGQMETLEETETRFQHWYMEQVGNAFSTYRDAGNQVWP
jgi:hypothetical protein